MFLFQYRTDFEYLQEIPILTLDVNEDFKGKKDRYDHMTEKVKSDETTYISTLIANLSK